MTIKISKKVIITLAVIIAVLTAGLLFGVKRVEAAGNNTQSQVVKDLGSGAAGTVVFDAEAEVETEAAADSTSAKAFAAAIAIGLAACGGAIAMGLAIGKSSEGISRQPEAAGDIRGALMIGLVFIETAIIYALIVTIMIIFVM